MLSEKKFKKLQKKMYLCLSFKIMSNFKDFLLHAYVYFVYFLQYTGAVVWMFASSQNSWVEILMPSVMTLGSWAFAKWLDHEERALKNEINALKRGD